ncbi:hypothetical protein FDP41_000525 [Naegleria fowleri]|uniref:Uncharacterized protein n=1 Tax=Naegleria fowleri TaxID=5763 RepID=A0A6A5CA52_NAEFO|nr:uncharacterized protein FDP41_000525 [Naegleria fowleri]KAF0984626.1 hypothetical protein FDP41_000525 [Naegleria fowleri]
MFSIKNSIIGTYSVFDDSNKKKSFEISRWSGLLQFFVILFTLAEEVWYFLRRPFLLFQLYHEFNKNDYKITVFPMSFYGLTHVTVQRCLGVHNMHETIQRALSLAFMSLSFVLSFTISNQIAGIEEDRKNKPWRPLIRKLCSIDFAYLLLILSTAVYLIHGYVEDVFWYCVVWVITFVFHNHLKGDQLWWCKNLCNLVGAFCMQSSCCKMMTGGPIDDFSTLFFAVTSLYFWAIIDMQDFRDGRRQDYWT